jgi:hypothetical protein
MTRKHHPTLIVTLIGETIRALQRGAPISKELVMILLEAWPDLSRNAIAREGEDWINLLQAAAARIELAPDD